MQFNYALRGIVIRNRSKPSSTGNCTYFGVALYESHGLFDLNVKRNQTKQITHKEHSYLADSCETLLMELDQEILSELLEKYIIFQASL